MNRILINSAAAINIAAAALIYIACSGDDGKDGAGCEARQTAAGADIYCGGVKQGSLNNGSDAGVGNCVLKPGAAGYDIYCDGANVGPLPSGGAGGCTITDGDKYWIFNCGTTPTQIAKAWCGDVAYNPSKSVCDLSTGEVSDAKCGLNTINLDYEFCSAGKKYFLCGTRSVSAIAGIGTPGDTIVAQGIVYDPATQFCYSNIYFPKGSNFTLAAGAAKDTVYSRCGTGTAGTAGNNPAIGTDLAPAAADSAHSNHNPRGNGWYDTKREFCYTDAAGPQITTLCAPSTNIGGPSDPLYGSQFTIGQVCISGAVQATCGNNPPQNYNASESFCQGAGASATVKPLCGPDELTYTSDQFCQVPSGGTGSIGSGLDAGAALDYSASSVATAKVETRCVTAAGKAGFFPTEFCQTQPGTNANSIVKPLCGLTAETLQKYTSTQFCQLSSSPSNGTTEITTIGASESYAAIKDKCGSGAAAKVFPPSEYCPSGGAQAGSPQTSPYCTSTGRAASGSPTDKPFDPEIEFCVNGLIYPTCAARTPDVNGPAPYDVTKVVCEPRSNNAKLDIVLFDAIATSNTWLVKNVTLNGASTFTWNEANTIACPQEPKDYSTTPPTNVWRLPSEADWNALAAAADPNSTPALAGANAGINLRTTTGWGQYPSTDAVYSKFAATPAAVTGVTPAPVANSAYWWSSGQGGWTTDAQGLPVAGSDLNLGNYRYTAELNPTLAKGGSPKLSTRLSVRCVRDLTVCSNTSRSSCTSQAACEATAVGGTWTWTAGSCPLTLSGGKINSVDGTDCDSELATLQSALSGVSGVSGATLTVGTFSTDNCPLTLASGAKISGTGANAATACALTAADAVFTSPAVGTLAVGSFTGTTGTCN